eukprot:scaffold31831_cov49-Phaeocystis_antarctica.AAC.2
MSHTGGEGGGGGGGGEGGSCGGEGGDGGEGGERGGGGEGGGSIETARNTGSHCGGQVAAWTAGRAFELRWPTACGRTTSKPRSTVPPAFSTKVIFLADSGWLNGDACCRVKGGHTVRVGRREVAGDGVSSTACGGGLGFRLGAGHTGRSAP